MVDSLKRVQIDMRRRTDLWAARGSRAALSRYGSIYLWGSPKQL
jgi:hypothetical protein